MKLRFVSFILLGQVLWLTAACSTVSTSNPVDNWSNPTPQTGQKTLRPNLQAVSEASSVDHGYPRPRPRVLETEKVRQRAEWIVPSSAIQTARRNQSSGLSLGERETAPEGLRDFCLRQPQLCNIVATKRPRSERQEGGFMLTGMGPDLSDSDPVHALTESSAKPIRAFAATAHDLTQINQINRQINRAMIGVTDQVAFGRAEFWTMPLSAPESRTLNKRPLADCEDFALEKRHALIAAGIPETALYLAVVFSPRTSLHAVLVVATDKGDLVLDNLNDWIVAHQETGYTWIKVQSTSSLLDWAAAVQPDQSRSLRFATSETRVSTRRDNEAQPPTIALALAWERTANGQDASEPVVSSIRPTGGRSE